VKAADRRGVEGTARSARVLNRKEEAIVRCRSGTSKMMGMEERSGGAAEEKIVGVDGRAAMRPELGRDPPLRAKRHSVAQRPASWAIRRRLSESGQRCSKPENSSVDIRHAAACTGMQVVSSLMIIVRKSCI
jgi:hypothetical protein